MQVKNKYSDCVNEAYRMMIANIAKELVQFAQDFHIQVFDTEIGDTMHAINDTIGDHFHEYFGGDFEKCWMDVYPAVRLAIQEEKKSTLITFLKPTVHYKSGETVKMAARYAEQYLKAGFAYNAEDAA